jgi:copper chaperone CopZ
VCVYCLPARNMLIVITFALMASPAFAADSGGTVKVQIIASDMCCQGCVQNVAAQLYALPGVTAVEADVASRTVILIAKPSPRLTLQRVWQAVEKGKGGPTKLTTPTATYSLTRLENLKSEERLQKGQYSLVLRDQKDRAAAQRVANQVYKIHGVTNVSLDAQRHSLIVQTSAVVLSPWTLVTAAQQAQAEATAVKGPHGLFTIERPPTESAGTAARPINNLGKGDIR